MFFWPTCFKMHVHNEAGVPSFLLYCALLDHVQELKVCELKNAAHTRPSWKENYATRFFIQKAITSYFPAADEVEIVITVTVSCHISLYHEQASRSFIPVSSDDLSVLNLPSITAASLRPSTLSSYLLLPLSNLLFLLLCGSSLETLDRSITSLASSAPNTKKKTRGLLHILPRLR